MFQSFCFVALQISTLLRDFSNKLLMFCFHQKWKTFELVPQFVIFQSKLVNSFLLVHFSAKVKLHNITKKWQCNKSIELVCLSCTVLHFKWQFQAAKRKRKRENTHLLFRSHIWAFAEGILKTLDVTCFPNSHWKWCCSNNISYQRETNSGGEFSYTDKPTPCPMASLYYIWNSPKSA